MQGLTVFMEVLNICVLLCTNMCGLKEVKNKPSRYTFSVKSQHSCFWASDPLIDRFYQNLSIKVFEALKQKLHELFYECCDLTEKVYLLFILFLQ